MTEEQTKNDRARRMRDRQRVESRLQKLERAAREALHRQDNWIAREARKQGIWAQ